MFLETFERIFKNKKRIHFEIVKDLSEAKKWWEVFTPKNTIYDEWEFRECVYSFFNYELFFCIGFIGDRAIGLLPLEFNTDEHCLEFFGGVYMDDNRVYVHRGHEKYIPDFFDFIKTLQKPLHLAFMVGEDRYIQKFPINRYTYHLLLENFKNGYDYIDRCFDGETKKKLLKRIKKIDEQPHELLLNNFEDIELLFKYNIESFHQDSTFNTPHRQDMFRAFLKLSFEPCLITYIVNNEKQAVSLALLYKDCFVSLNSGVNESIKEMSEFSRFKRIDYAIKIGKKWIDARTGDCGWKEKWGFTKIPQYIFEKK